MNASERTAQSRGAVITVAGPDGAGKTTIAEELTRRLSAHSRVLRVHSRSQLLPRRTPVGDAVTAPHERPPYPGPLSLMKASYLFLDFLLGWLLRIRPFVRDGGWVVVERGWWDVAVDPVRYRLGVPGGLLSLLGNLLPQPDLVLVLEAPPELMAARKRELTQNELARQTESWRSRLPARVARIYVDAARAPDDIARQAESEAIRVLRTHTR
jgi:thymidylate kinase